jgi:hypothetical protein
MGALFTLIGSSCLSLCKELMSPVQHAFSSGLWELYYYASPVCRVKEWLVFLSKTLAQRTARGVRQTVEHSEFDSDYVVHAYKRADGMIHRNL